MCSNACILVTGGAGFIGANFIHYVLGLEEFQGRVVNLDALTYAANLGNLQEIAEDPRYHFEKGDIRDAAKINDLNEKYNFDLIVHFAAESHVDRSIEAPKVFLDTNVIGTYQLLEFVRMNPEIHFHHVSTDEVYGSIAEGKFNESSPYLPNSPYAASKAASDHLVRAYHKTYGIKMTMSHSSNNYGPFQSEEKFIPRMIRGCIRKEPLPIYGTGDNIRDWIYVEDHVRALWMILKNGAIGETYGIGGNNEWKNMDLLNHLTLEFAAIVHQDVEEYRALITSVSDRLGHDYRYALDTSKIERDLEFFPEYDFTEGLQKTIIWYKENEENRLCHTS
ncbi:MAG: dTDP-glucose 4,6-dehydratase [Simkaniaceae bacterium]|nr:dTDP-glucose 4,6-dehydratase [Simkaniaceae bacterium]